MLVVLLLLLPGKHHPAPPTNSTANNGSPPKAGEPDTPADTQQHTPPVAAEEPPRPQFLLSSNESDTPTLFQGWPLLVYSTLLHPQAYARNARIEPMLLAAADGPWTGAVRLEVKDAKGKKVEWPFHLATTATPTVTLDHQTFGSIGWWLTPDETAGLQPGAYELTAILDTSSARADGAWKGNAHSRQLRIEVIAEPKVLDAEREEEKFLLLAHFAMFRGDDKEALSHVEALLAKQPKSVTALERKGDLLAAGGKTLEALRSYDAALAGYRKRNLPDKPPGEPPALLRKHQKVLIRFLSKG